MSMDGEQLEIRKIAGMESETQAGNPFGEALRMLRNRHRDTQESLAQKLHVSRQTISNWEQGKATPDYETNQRLCKIYGVSADYFTERREGADILGETEEKFLEIWQDDEQLRKVLLSCAIAIAVMLTIRLPFLGIGISIISLAANRKWKIYSGWLDIIILFCLGVGLYKTGVIVGYIVSCLGKIMM